jgi:hypothetical protein
LGFEEGKYREYESELDSITRKLEKTIEKYPNDEEIKVYFNDFLSFIEERKKGMKPEKEKKEISEFLSNLRHIIEWRKLGMSSGSRLPYKDYRSLRGERGRR